MEPRKRDAELGDTASGRSFWTRRSAPAFEWSLQPVTLRRRFATREARSFCVKAMVDRLGVAHERRAPALHVTAGASLSKFATREMVAVPGAAPGGLGV
jgi:hypothetical protein